MARNIIECDHCGAKISLGGEFWRSDLTDRKGQRFFCSEKCMKEYIIDTILDDVLDEWIDDHAEWCNLEESDPYDRYGISRSDF